MFASNTTNVNEQPDAQFNYVTMLLHGDGTNGAQNNTFLDSSTNNFTITRNGNTTQGTFSPYGSNWSNYFDGTGDEVLFGSASDWTFLSNGASSWTVEGWFYISKTDFSIMLDTSNSNGGYVGFTVSFNETANTVQSDIFPTSGGSNFRIISTANAFSYNTWTHIAVTFNHSTKIKKLYINGVLNATLDMTGFSFSSSAPNKTLGVSWSGGGGSYAFLGSLSNIRIVKDSVVYTSNFTPSTAPLTAITGTQLLTCQSNRFRDASTNAFASTVNGNPSVQRFSPFAPTAAYSAATIGGSGYFDGNGDYLLAPANSNLELGSSDFTIEFWWYTTVSSRQALYHGSFGTDWSIGIDCTSQKMGIWASSNGTSWNLVNADGGGNGVGTITVPVNQWNHIAYVRSGTTWMLYVNGVRDLNLTGISGSIVNRSSSQKAIGAWWSAGVSPGPTTGYIQDFRILKGTALYTGATYTVPTSPLTAITNTQLLLNFTNAGIIDNAMMNDLETVGNAQISTSVKKYGTGSLAFDGTGDYLKTASTPQLGIGSGDFTIEAWVYFNAAQTSVHITDGMSSGAMFLKTTATQVGIGRSFIAEDTMFNYSFATGTWYHIAFTRSGSTVRGFVNGTSIGSATNTINYATAGLTVGADNGGNQALNGYIDDLRITKGYARYTANFTAPTAAFPNN